VRKGHEKRFAQKKNNYHSRIATTKSSEFFTQQKGRVASSNENSEMASVGFILEHSGRRSSLVGPWWKLEGVGVCLSHAAQICTHQQTRNYDRERTGACYFDRMRQSFMTLLHTWDGSFAHSRAHPVQAGKTGRSLRRHSTANLPPQRRLNF